MCQKLDSHCAMWKTCRDWTQWKVLRSPRTTGVTDDFPGWLLKEVVLKEQTFAPESLFLACAVHSGVIEQRWPRGQANKSLDTELLVSGTELNELNKFPSIYLFVIYFIIIIIIQSLSPGWP